MAIYILQAAAKHKPPGPYWTGANWSGKENAKNYVTLALAEKDMHTAHTTASRDLLLMEDDFIHARVRVASRGQARNKLIPFYRVA